MKDTVHFMKLSYAKNLDHLKAHLRYVGRKSACVFVNKKPEGIAEFYRFVVERKGKIKNARVAYKFYLALPIDWYWLGRIPDFWKNRAEDLCQILSEVFGIKKEDAIVFFHKPTGKEEKNFHAHVLMKTVKADGRCLDVKKAHLRAFHQAWQEYLTNAGYQIFRARDYIPEITPKISRAFDLPVYLYRREDFMPEAKRLYQRIRTEARRLMEMKRRPTRMEERELREKKEAQLQNPPQLKPELKPDKEPEPELQPELQPQPEPEPQPDKEPEPQPEPEEEPEPKPQQQSQQQPQPRPKSVDYLAFIIARNLLEAGRPREEAFIRLYNYLRKKHPEKANLVYVSNIVNKALLSLMEEQRKKEQRDYPESDEFLGPGL